MRMDSRKAAAAILKTLARHKSGGYSFCCRAYYDDDTEFLHNVAEHLGMTNISTTSFERRLQRVCRMLEDARILFGQITNCRAEYFGEPRFLKRYEFSNAGDMFRLAPDVWTHYRPQRSPEQELETMLQRVFF